MDKVSRSYCSQTDVENAMGVVAAETNVTQAIILAAIQDASAEVDYITHTTYHSIEDYGTATSGTTTSLTDSTKSDTWTANEWTDYVLWIYSGTGSGQYSRITSNTTTVLILTDTLTTAPDDTSEYRIIPDVYEDVSVDGDGSSKLFLHPYPIKSLLSLTVNSTSVTPAKVTIYENDGKLNLYNNLSPEKTYFDNTYPKLIDIKYVYGIYPIPRLVIKLTANIAAIQCLITQIGGTYNDVTSYTIPHLTASKGEPYTNIRETLSRLEKENEKLIQRITKYPIMVI